MMLTLGPPEDAEELLRAEELPSFLTRNIRLCFFFLLVLVLRSFFFWLLFVLFAHSGFEELDFRRSLWHQSLFQRGLEVCKLATAKK